MVTGSAIVTSETRSLADWTAVALSCPGTLDLEVGKNRGITIEAEENILPLIETHVEHNRLVIRFKSVLGSIQPTMPIRLQAATPAVEALAVSGSGNIRAPQIESAQLALDVSGSGAINVASVNTGTIDTRISGSGTITVRGQALDHDIRVSGSGDLNARELTSQRAVITISGSGSALVRVERDIEGRISGSGSIVYSGQPNTAIHISGSGRATQIPE